MEALLGFVHARSTESARAVAVSPVGLAGTALGSATVAPFDGTPYLTALPVPFLARMRNS